MISYVYATMPNEINIVSPYLPHCTSLGQALCLSGYHNVVQSLVLCRVVFSLNFATLGTQLQSVCHDVME